MLALGDFVQSPAVLSALPTRFQYVEALSENLLGERIPLFQGGVTHGTDNTSVVPYHSPHHFPDNITGNTGMLNRNNCFLALMDDLKYSKN